MGHVLLALPEIRHFHLHSRVARKLTTREHRVTVLAGDPVSYEFYSHQGLACRELVPGSRAATRHLVPVREFALADACLAGDPSPGSAALGRFERRLLHWLDPMVEALEADPPDLLLFHEGRTGRERMLRFLAEQYGAKVLHIGPGLLPMTMQVDRDGVDAEASFARATPRDYREARIDDPFLAAATAGWLGRAYPPPLARVSLAVPSPLRRFAACTRAVLRGDWKTALHGMGAWRDALGTTWPRLEEQPEMPPAPFVAVLLQDGAEPRRRLDTGPISDAALVYATVEAVRALDPEARIVVVGPESRSAAQLRRQLRGEPVHFVPSSAGALAAATALAVVTVNHPLGLAAILVGTPVLHTGRTPYGIRGVAHHTSLPELKDDLVVALREERRTLRRRFLTRMLKDHHIWCPPSHPDSNGVAGLVTHIETVMDSPRRRNRPLRYRPGPVWPLAVTAPSAKRDG